eukprot:CAMPEP_0178782922 /NCGR_PEP_ID=MMETSP0745-20121128/3405_1 /TAXON_ID=913974 /ORGANISM="Nitzschia punctata, Strain CCMP561" /LENGTH=109 /DNA_ID=CAMNT_0020440389 /DNA_START=36 /DNA_END=365 /DNA_ORIENTATION=+
MTNTPRDKPTTDQVDNRRRDAINGVVENQADTLEGIFLSDFLASLRVRGPHTALLAQRIRNGEQPVLHEILEAANEIANDSTSQHANGGMDSDATGQSPPSSSSNPTSD